MDGSNSMFEELLPNYYKREFPLKLWCRWVAAGCSPQPLANRELSFTLSHDVYIRYLSIRNPTDLRNMLEKKKPFKIDIGAVYDVEPTLNKQRSIIVSRELVFDIDLTDYDDVRTCCKGAGICNKCWKFMIVACQVLEESLKEDFGFTSVLWVYSGRRGIHCWVSCPEAKNLTSNARSAVADYLALISGGESQLKKVHLNSENIHSSIKRALAIINKIFNEILDEQQFISSTEGLAKFVKLIPDDALALQVFESLKSMPADSKLRWKAFQDVYASYWSKQNGLRRIRHLIEEIQLQWCYPRLDINVSKGLNHLLKAPFSVHPKTEKVCVVFRASDVVKLDPSTVPTLSDLLDEQSPNYTQAQSLMQQSVNIFQSYVFALEKEVAKHKKETNENSLDF